MRAMTRAPFALAPLTVLAIATAAPAQDPAAVYQQQPKQSFRFTGDTLARYEWTKDIPVVGAPAEPGGDPVHGVVDENRYRLQLRPRIEMRIGPVELGVGGEF